jgi:autotransporter-associated beta strand protein
MKTKILSITFSTFLLAAIPLSANTYNWVGGGANTGWGAANWSPAATFDNNAQLVWNSTIDSAFSFLGADRIARSLTFGNDFDIGAGRENYTIRLRTGATTGDATLSLRTAPSITLEQDLGLGKDLKTIFIGNNFGTFDFRNTNLEVNQNSTNVLLRFNTPITTAGGGGGINKNGAGAMELYRVNAFGNGVNINAGTVAIWNQASAAGTGSITLGAAAGAAAATLAAGGQSSAAVTFANNIIVNSGDGARTIRNYESGLVPTLSGNITLNKTVTFDVANHGVNQDVLISSGEISGNHGIVKSGVGGLLLNGVNTYTGNTTVDGAGAGYVRITADSGLGAAPVSATASHLVLNNGALVTGGNFTLAANRGIELAGVGGQIFTETGTQLAYDGIITGNEFQKAGNGTLVLGGVNEYTGATTVSAGTLLINGSTASGSAVTVANGATLGGTGTINGAITVDSGGILSPGNSIGQLTVGSLSLNSGANLVFGLTSNATAGTTYDQIDGTSLTLSGGTVNLTLNGIGSQSISLGDTFTLFTGMVTGFDTTTFNITNNTSWTGSWQVSEGSLILTAIPEPSTWALLAGTSRHLLSSAGVGGAAAESGSGIPRSARPLGGT